MPNIKPRNIKSKKKQSSLTHYFYYPFLLIYSCLLKFFKIFKFQMSFLKKGSKIKKYQKIAFGTTISNSNELVKLPLFYANNNLNLNNTVELFSPNSIDGENILNINKNDQPKDKIISIINEEKTDCYSKVLNNLGKTASSKRHLIFKKITFGKSGLMKKRIVLSGTDLSLTKYIEVNKKFMEELKPEELLIKSKELEETLMEKLCQPIVLRNKKLVIKTRSKKRSFIPTKLTTIFEDLNYF